MSPPKFLRFKVSSLFELACQTIAINMPVIITCQKNAALKSFYFEDLIFIYKGKSKLSLQARIIICLGQLLEDKVEWTVCNETVQNCLHDVFFVDVLAKYAMRTIELNIFMKSMEL